MPLPEPPSVPPPVPSPVPGVSASGSSGVSAPGISPEMDEPALPSTSCVVSSGASVSGVSGVSSGTSSGTSSGRVSSAGSEERTIRPPGRSPQDCSPTSYKAWPHSRWTADNCCLPGRLPSSTHHSLPDRNRIIGCISAEPPRYIIIGRTSLAGRRNIRISITS